MFGQAAQFGGVDRPRHVRAGRKDLTEFDEGGPQFLQQTAQFRRTVKSPQIAPGGTDSAENPRSAVGKQSVGQLVEAVGAHGFDDGPESADEAQIPVEFHSPCQKFLHSLFTHVPETSFRRSL